MSRSAPPSAAGSRVVLATSAVVFALSVLPIANWITASPHVEWWSFAMQQWGQRLILLFGTASLVGLLAGTHTDAWLRRLHRVILRLPTRWLLGAACAWTALITGVLAAYCFSQRALSIDEIAQTFHADILLHGRLTVAVPLHPAFFAGTNLISTEGRWASQFPFGGPALLALARLVHLPWLLGPAVTAGTLAMSYRLMRATGGELEARVAVLLLSLCPFFLFMGATSMNHMPAAFAGVWALAAAFECLDAASAPAVRRTALEIGVALGSMMLLRPLEALVCAVAVGLVLLERVWKNQSAGLRVVCWAGLGMAPCAVALLLSNAAVTGHALESGYTALWGPAHGLGFHPAPYGQPHTPLRGVGLVSGYLMRASLYLLEWPVPAMPVLAVALMALARWSPAARRQSQLALYAVTMSFAYGFYWHNGFYLGPRFLFAAVPVMIYLLVAGWIMVERQLGPHPRARLAFGAFPLLSTAWAWTSTDPLASVRTRAGEYAVSMPSLKFDVAKDVRQHGVDHAIVLLREGWGSALMVRLWDAGVSRPDAEWVFAHSDACRLQEALDALEGQQHPASAQDRRRLREMAQLRGPAMTAEAITGDASLRFDAPVHLSSACMAQVARDREGVLPFQPLLAEESFSPTGALTGRVVYARDLWPRNAALLGDFPGRVWYRYRRTAQGPTLVRITPQD